MERVRDPESSEDDTGPVTRRIHYVDRSRPAGAQRDTGARSRGGARLSEDDGRSEVERARRRLRHALSAFRETLRNTARDLGLATRSVATCTARWVHAERDGLATQHAERER